MHRCFIWINLGGVGFEDNAEQRKHRGAPFRKGLGVRRGHQTELPERDPPSHGGNFTGSHVTYIQILPESSDFPDS